MLMLVSIGGWATHALGNGPRPGLTWKRREGTTPEWLELGVIDASRAYTTTVTPCKGGSESAIAIFVARSRTNTLP